MGVKFKKHSAKPASKKEASDIHHILNKEISLFGSSFSNSKKEKFYSRLSVLLKSGINLRKSLELIAEGQKKEKDQTFIEGLSSDIVDGKSFHEIMKGHKNFSPYEFHAIKIGEQTGKLDDLTQDLFHFYQNKNEQRRQVYSALSYPMIILLTALVVVYFMMQFVVPMFVDIFKQQEVELPLITQVIVKISNFITSYGGYLILLLIALPFLRRWLKTMPKYRKASDAFKLKIPIIGGYIKKVYISQFVQAMALLTRAKVPIVNGISLTKDMIAFDPLQNSLQTIEEDIVNGKKMSESFAKHKLYDKDMVALLKVAEETNQTEFVFQKLQEQYSNELKYSSQIITAALNPLFIFLVAGIVGVILIAMYLPMFKLSSVFE